MALTDRMKSVLLEMVEERIWTESRPPAEASNTSSAFSPAEEVTVSGGPPATIVRGTEPLTDTESDPPAAVASAVMVIEPEAAGV